MKIVNDLSFLVNMYLVDCEPNKSVEIFRCLSCSKKFRGKSIESDKGEHDYPAY